MRWQICLAFWTEIDLSSPPNLRQNQRQTFKEATPEKEEIALSINVSRRPARCESNGASYADIPSFFIYTSDRPLHVPRSVFQDISSPCR